MFEEGEISFEEMMALSDEEINKLLGEYEEYKKERAQFLHDSFIELPAHPPLVLDAIQYLIVNKGVFKEGIFRVNGDSKVVDTIRKAYITTVDTDDILLSLQSVEKLNCYDVATALKSYFRLLDKPLVPFDIYEEMKNAVEGQTDRTAQVKGITAQIARIPEPNISILCYLMKFLQKIIDLKEKNKMTANNMATCLTMSITRFLPEEGKSNTHLLAMLEVGLSTKIISLMLNEVDFDAFITPQKVYELLSHTQYRKDLIPKTYQAFLESDYHTKKPVDKEETNLPPKVPPRAPPRAGRANRGI